MSIKKRENMNVKPKLAKITPGKVLGKLDGECIF